jgi:hypothetical protein
MSLPAETVGMAMPIEIGPDEVGTSIHTGLELEGTVDDHLSPVHPYYLGS